MAAIALPGIGLGQPSQAIAATGGYPFAKFHGPGSRPHEYVWTDSRGNAISRYSYYYRNCTDYVAWKLAKANKFGNSRGLGNAVTWRGRAGARGYKANRTPARGAVAWWGSSVGGGFGHVAWVKSFGGGKVTLQDYNWRGDGTYGVRTVPVSSVGRFIHFKDLKRGSGSDPNPRGHLDKAGSPAAGKVRAAGWAFDPNKKTTPVTIHVYVGGKAGQKGAKGYSIGRAGKTRNDVAKAFKGVGAKHGFDQVFKTSKRGKQKVCVYAINVGPGSNVLLGCKTVNVHASKAPSPPSSAPVSSGDSSGWYDPGPHGWHLRNSLSSGPSNYIFPRGSKLAGQIPVVGDWDGDGRDSSGWYDPGPHGWHLRNSLSSGPSNYIFPRGKDGSIPVVGDWDGDGRDSSGWYDPGPHGWHLRNSLSKGASNYIFARGKDEAIPVVGDWNGDGKDSTGLYFPWDQTWHLRNSLSPGPSNYAFKRGKPDAIPVVGDWNGDGKDSTGLYFPWDQTWHLRNSLSPGPSNYAFKRGKPGTVPVVGNWDGK